jgi:hypothetical protein
MPTIERIIKESGLPDDLKFISVAESNLQNVVSPAKAAGFWQFMTSTAKEYGLEVNAEVDERYHLEKATRAACRYFREAYSRYGSWATAAASYNAGMGYINNQTELQKTSNYYDLALNQETSRYVYRTVAYKLIMQSPESYGFAVSPSDYPPLRYREVKVKGSVNWIDFAIENGTNYKLLRYFNPWIRDRKLTNKLGKSYTVKIPERR